MARLVCVIVLSLVACSRCCAQDAMPENTARADPAKMARVEASVCKWLANGKNRRLVLKRITESSQGPSCYHLETDDGQTLVAAADSGEVVCWSNDRYKSNGSTGLRRRRMSDRQVDKCAETFARQRYERFATDKMQIIRPQLFWRRLDNGVWDPGLRIKVSVDHYTGEVFAYQLWRQSGRTHISTNPRVSSNKAEAIAIDMLSRLPVCKDECSGTASAFVVENRGASIYYDSLGLQRLIWSLSVVTSNLADYKYSDYLNEKKTGKRMSGRLRYVQIDALSGELAYVDGFELAGVISGLQEKSLNMRSQELKRLVGQVALYKRTSLFLGNRPAETCMPPLLIKGQPFLPVRLVAALLGRDVLYASGSSAVISGANRVEFKTNTASAKVGANPVEFGLQPTMLLGRLYVPLQAIRPVFCITPKWDESSNTVFWPTTN